MLVNKNEALQKAGWELIQLDYGRCVLTAMCTARFAAIARCACVSVSAQLLCACDCVCCVRVYEVYLGPSVSFVGVVPALSLLLFAGFGGVACSASARS